jgi:hypothetical protein
MSLKIGGSMHTQFKARSFLGLLILNLGAGSHAWAACPDIGCAPFEVSTEPPYLPDSLYNHLNLQPEKPMQVELLPRDTGMTWEYQYASHSDNRSVITTERYLLRLKLVASKDSGNDWISRWQYGYQGWRRFSIVQTTLTEVPWTTFDTTITKAKDSGLHFERFLPFRSREAYFPSSRWMMRPLVNDTFAIGPCCNHPIAKGQSESDLYVVSRMETAIYQKDRGIIYFRHSYVGPDVAGHRSATLSYYGREPGPVPVRSVFAPRNREKKPNGPGFFRANEYRSFNVLGRAIEMHPMQLSD